MKYVFLPFYFLSIWATQALFAEPHQIVSIKGDCFIDRLSQKIKVSVHTGYLQENDHLFCHRNSGIKLVLKNIRLLSAINELDLLLIEEKNTTNYKLYLGQISITQPQKNNYSLETPSTRIDSTAQWAHYSSNKTVDLELGTVPHSGSNIKITLFDNRGIVQETREISAPTYFTRKEYSLQIAQKNYTTEMHLKDLVKYSQFFREDENLDQSHVHSKNVLLQDNLSGLQLEDQIIPKRFGIIALLDDEKFSKKSHDSLMNQAMFARQMSRFGQDTLLQNKTKSVLLSMPWLNYHAPLNSN